MKRSLRSILCGGLAALLLPLMAIADGQGDGNLNHGAQVAAYVTDRLVTRSGPATKYRETGIFEIQGESVRLISFSYDDNDICWVQCDVPMGGTLRRVYTGAKRFNGDTFDLADLPEEIPLDEKAKVIATTRALYGPFLCCVRIW